MGRPSLAPVSLPDIEPLPTKAGVLPFSLSIADAAAYVGLSPRSIRREVYAGRLASRTYGERGVHLIKRTDLESWYAQLPPFTDLL